jgi:hypothetical protein
MIFCASAGDSCPLSAGVAHQRDDALDVLQGSFDALGVTLFEDPVAIFPHGSQGYFLGSF